MLQTSGRLASLGLSNGGWDYLGEAKQLLAGKNLGFCCCYKTTNMPTSVKCLPYLDAMLRVFVDKAFISSIRKLTISSSQNEWTHLQISYENLSLKEHALFSGQ